MRLHEPIVWQPETYQLWNGTNHIISGIDNRVAED